ncbi:MAG: hypothetical protein H6644_01095 [Caldilineaceae bacterium]|nr:hypothetical protein [Caldilineaceae bacterium]
MTTATIVRKRKPARWSPAAPGFMANLETGELWTVDHGSKPSSCPYCHSSNVSAHAGFWECHDCGQSGSY